MKIDLHFEIPECQIYHGALIGSKSQTELDHLDQPHVLDRLEDKNCVCHGNVCFLLVLEC
jgi:hypothetical protein